MYSTGCVPSPKMPRFHLHFLFNLTIFNLTRFNLYIYIYIYDLRLICLWNSLLKIFKDMENIIEVKRTYLLIDFNWKVLYIIIDKAI